VAQRGPT